MIKIRNSDVFVAFGMCRHASGEKTRYESALFDERAEASEEFALSADSSRDA
jgi:hypothetical protein